MPTRRLILAAPALLLGRAAAAQDGVIRVVSPWTYDTPDPVETGFMLKRLGIAETLVHVRPDGGLEGGVAERWAVDDDRLTWRFTLRDARFHDGTPVTAALVAACLERVWPRAETLATIPLAALEPAGERTLVIRTRSPFAPLPAFLTDYAGVILAPGSYAGPGYRGDAVRAIATGPFRLVATGGAQTIDAEAVGDQPIRALRYTAAPLGEARANLIESGAADVAYTLLPQAAERIEAAGRARVLRTTIPRVRNVAMNLMLPQFADLRVRQALSMATDRGGIARAVLRHPASAATQLLPPMLEGWHDAGLPPLVRDVEGARRLLDEAGWRAGADGVRVKDGQRLAATMLVPANRPELPVMGEALQAQWRAVGMAVTLQPGPAAAQPAAVRAGTLQMAALARTYVNVPDPIGTILPDFAGAGTSIWASPGYDSAEVRALAAAYLEAFDYGPRAALRRRIAAVLHRDLPVIPVSWFEHNAAVGPRLAVGSVALDPYEQRYLLSRSAWA